MKQQIENEDKLKELKVLLDEFLDSDDCVDCENCNHMRICNYIYRLEVVINHKYLRR